MRKLMWFTIGFFTACVFASWQYVPWLPAAAVGVFLFFIGFVLLSRLWKYFRIVATVFLGIAVGLCWYCGFDALYLSNARACDGQTKHLTLEVSDYSQESSFGSAVEGYVEIGDKQYRVCAYLDGKEQLLPGDTVTASFKIRYTSGGGEKASVYHESDGIYLILSQKSDATIGKVETIPARYLPAVWRMKLLEKIRQSFPADAAGFACALVLGDRSGIDYETETAFSVSGISHVIAVSGLHVSILFGLIYILTMRRRVAACVFGIPALLVFAAMAGFTPSITRACIMQILMLLALLFNKEYDPPTALSFSVLCMLACNPMVVYSVSFQLSVGCIIGIFLLSKRIHSWLMDDNRLGRFKKKKPVFTLARWISSGVSVTLGAGIFTTPLVAYYFGVVSLVSIFTNLLTLWVISIIFYGVILCAALAFVLPGVAAFLGTLVAIPVYYVTGVAKWMASLPFAAVYTQSIYTVLWLSGSYLMLGIYLLFKRKHAVLFTSLSAVLLCVSMFASWAEPLTDDCRVTMLDVGQGQSVILQSEGKTYLVDCGGSTAQMAADQAAQTLLSQGVSRIDGIILTHFDEDHAGGVLYLLQRIRTDLLIVPDTQQTQSFCNALKAVSDAEVLPINTDHMITFGDTSITVFSPEITDSGNESSLGILFQTEKCDILITGDRSTLGEELLLRRVKLPELELLIAGHHGSNGSTGEPLLSATTPENVFISVGRNNYYGHPGQELLQRLNHYGCSVYRTDVHGTIIYRG